MSFDGTDGGPIRSRAILDAARGQPCLLRIAPDCDGGGASGTTVACHIRDRFKGMGTKASDLSTVFGCSACHKYLDEGPGTDQTDAAVAWAVIHAMQETTAILVALGLVVVPRPDKPPAPKPAPPRKPKGQRAKIQGSSKILARKDGWPKGRKLAARPTESRRGPGP